MRRPSFYARTLNRHIRLGSVSNELRPEAWISKIAVGPQGPDSRPARRTCAAAGRGSERPICRLTRSSLCGS